MSLESNDCYGTLRPGMGGGLSYTAVSHQGAGLGPLWEALESVMFILSLTVTGVGWLLPPMWTCHSPGILRRPSVPRDTAQGYRWERRQTRPAGDTRVHHTESDCSDQQTRVTIQPSRWRWLDDGQTYSTLYFPGFFRAQMSAPWPPME